MKHLILAVPLILTACHYPDHRADLSGLGDVGSCAARASSGLVSYGECRDGQSEPQQTRRPVVCVDHGNVITCQ